MHSLFLSKVPVNELLQVPLYRAPMETAAHLPDLFYLSLKFLIKISLNKKFISSLKEPRKGVSLHVPQNGAPTETDIHFHSLT